jgi:hypothetical protein
VTQATILYPLASEKQRESGMQLFIGNLPRHLNPFELRRMVERVLLPQGFQETAKHFLMKKERLKRSEYEVFDKLTMFGIVRHGKATIEPDLVAQRAIERLNNTTFRGNVLVVREFIVRINNNDRRSLNWRMRSWAGAERRLRDRRQPTVDLEKKQDEFA